MTAAGVPRDPPALTRTAGTAPRLPPGTAAIPEGLRGSGAAHRGIGKLLIKLVVYKYTYVID